MTHKAFLRTSAFTWGAPMTAVGLLAALLLRGIAPLAHLLLGIEIAHTRYRGRTCFLLGHRWGGLTLGNVILCQHEPTEQLLDHEWGHTVQNALFGPLMPLLVLASAARYHDRNRRAKRGEPLPPYDAWWFEAQATALGTAGKENV